MKEIKDVRKKFGNDSRRVKAYEKYEKYEKMLKAYNEGIKLVPSTRNPFRTAGKIAQKAGFDPEEYERFCNEVDKILKKDPETNLNDLSSQKGRSVIGDIIAISQADDNFKNADLDSVAVAKYFYVCNEMNKARGKSEFAVEQVLKDNGISVQETAKKFKNYQRNDRKGLYERNRKSKAQDIVHITAAFLEIGPGEAESSLSAFNKIESKYYETEFDRSIKIRQDEVSKAVLDAIIMNDKLTDSQKKERIDAEYNKIAKKQKIIEAQIQEWKNKGKDVKDMPKGFMERNGISIKSEDDGKAM